MRVTEKVLLCPFCGYELSDVYDECCGEVGHGVSRELDDDGKIISLEGDDF